MVRWLFPATSVPEVLLIQYSRSSFSILLGGNSHYGVPSCVRSHRGGENIRIAHFMWSQRPQFQAMIMGRSVHIQQIERLWRDVFQGCISLYYELFTHLEMIGILDPSSELHLFILHYLYKEHIQRSLDRFKQAYIQHPLSSCGNRTPAQLFFSGALRYMNQRLFLPGTQVKTLLF